MQSLDKQPELTEGLGNIPFEQTEKKNMLSVKNLRVSFFTKAGEVKAVDGMTYQVERGKTIGIVGESGCGKTITSYAILGLIKYPGEIIGGEIIFQGKDICKMTPEEYMNIRGNKIGMIFQEAMTALNPVLTIGYQISEQILKHKSCSKREAKERTEELIDLVGIPSPKKRMHEYPHQLSGGMKQRSMIAMALSCDPDLLIADEPTTALDVTIQAQILDLMMSLQDKMKMAVQFITHDLGVISELADNIIVMYAGRIVESGSNQQIFDNPQHPYTRGLLSSIPRLKKNPVRLYTIPGNVPSLYELPTGCTFANRCNDAGERCFMEKPILRTINDAGQKIACFAKEN